MPASSAALRFPYSRVLLPRTRLAYVHLRNLLTDAKRDRRRASPGTSPISLPDELVMLYLLRRRGRERDDSRRARRRAPSPIAERAREVPHEPEYGEICFHEADPEQLGCMFATQATPPEPWPDGMAPQDPAALFPYLMATTFDGFVEIVANDT